MSPLQQLQSMLNEKYVTEDGEEYKINPGTNNLRGLGKVPGVHRSTGG